MTRDKSHQMQLGRLGMNIRNSWLWQLYSPETGHQRWGISVLGWLQNLARHSRGQPDLVLATALLWVGSWSEEPRDAPAPSKQVPQLPVGQMFKKKKKRSCCKSTTASKNLIIYTRIERPKNRAPTTHTKGLISFKKQSRLDLEQVKDACLTAVSTALLCVVWRKGFAFLVCQRRLHIVVRSLML